MALTITIESLIKDSLNSAWSMHSETTSLSLVFLCIAIHSFGSPKNNVPLALCWSKLCPLLAELRIKDNIQWTAGCLTLATIRSHSMNQSDLKLNMSA